MGNHGVSQKMLERTYHRIWTFVGAELSENLRKWGFSFGNLLLLYLIVLVKLSGTLTSVQQSRY